MNERSRNQRHRSPRHRRSAIAIVPQAIILGSIFGVTGIPPKENEASRSKGDAYRAYQARVSKFIPRPPKRT